MGIVYRTDTQKGISFVVWDGIVTAEVFAAGIRKLTSDPDWPPHRRITLSDIRTARLDASMTYAALERAAEMFGSFPEKLAGMKVAIVATEAFETSTAFEKLIAKYGPTMIVFNNLDTACIWLGIDVGEVEHILSDLRSESRSGDSPL